MRICKLLVTKNLDINININYIDNILSNTIISNNTTWINFCLKNGAILNYYLCLLNIYNTHINTTQYICINVVSLLLKYKATLKRCDTLTLIIRRRKLDIVKFLIKKGAIINKNYIINKFDNPN